MILLILFAVFGMVPSQLTFFLAIRYGNASTATILQFLGPVFIIVCLAIQYRKLPRRIDVISLMIAVLGTILIVTNGKIGTLALSSAGIFWGIMAGVSQASYTLISRRLLEQFDARLVTGLGMVIGSVLFWPLILTTKIPSITPFTVGSFAYIIIFGTMASYLCYLQSVKYIPASTTGMLSAFEPLTANVLSVIWFHETLGAFQTAGAVLILSTAFLQAMALKGK
ncbi:DMT family transporter [Ligilactobacillus ruminis]|uniref:DMT family transporter n=1 Tax=Ligilactobacillus ruminis TaxID=1623 RepID=UPI001F24BC40|nr:DMT family transporter [Ligilactobacillus ruminis]